MVSHKKQAAAPIPSVLPHMPSEEVSNTKKRKFLIVSLGFTLPRQDSSEIVINLLKNFYQAVVCVIFCGITKSIVERDYEMEYAVGK